MAAGLCALALLIPALPGGSPRADAGRLPGMMPRRATAAPGAGKLENRAAALARALSLGKGSERDGLVRDLLSGWASRDAEAALGWVSTLEDPAARRSARATVCLTVAERDPQRAIVLALAHGADEDDAGSLLECLTMQWCEKESQAVVEWAQGQAPGEWRERLLAGASFVLSKSDPVAAARLVSGMEPGAVQDEAAMAVLHQWSLKDSSAALEWAAAFPGPDLRERALAEISNLRHPMTAREAD